MIFHSGTDTENTVKTLTCKKLCLCRGSTYQSTDSVNSLTFSLQIFRLLTDSHYYNNRTQLLMILIISSYVLQLLKKTHNTP